MGLFGDTQSLGPIAGRNEFLTYNARGSYHPRRLFHRDVLESRLGRFLAHGFSRECCRIVQRDGHGMNLVKSLTRLQGLFSRR
jgi:hypothetical protein